jgi:hypothetical protein
MVVEKAKVGKVRDGRTEVRREQATGGVNWLKRLMNMNHSEPI